MTFDFCFRVRSWLNDERLEIALLEGNDSLRCRHKAWLDMTGQEDGAIKMLVRHVSWHMEAKRK